MGNTRRAFLRRIGATSVAAPTVSTTVVGQSGNASSLLLNWKPSGLHVPFYAAQANGFYKQEGLDNLEIKSGQGSDFSATQVGLGNTEFAVTSSDQLINVNSRGLSPISVGIVMQRSPVVVFTVRDVFGEPLKSADQLRGKRIGTGPGMVRILTKLLLKRKGVLNDVTLVNTGFDTVQQLLAGKIDAAGGVFGDAVTARHQGYRTDSIPVATVIPSYGHVLATSDSFSKNAAEAVSAFLRATAHGMVWGTRHPEKAIDALIDARPSLAETRSVQRDKWTVLARQFVLSLAVRNHGWGWSNARPWRATYRALKDAGLLGGTVDPRSVWTNTHLSTEYRYIAAYADIVSKDEPR